MTTKNLRRPDPRGGPQVRERWEQEVSKKLDNTTFTLDDAFRALLLTTGTTQGQENENAIRAANVLIASNRSLASRISELERKLEDNIMLAENRALRGKITDLEKKINDLEVVAWL